MANSGKEVAIFADKLKEVPTQMRVFSLCIRSLYAECQVGSKSEVSEKFNLIRDDTKRDALLYVKGILPISTTVVRSIKEFFEYYEDLDYSEWVENLSDIVDEVKGYRQCCNEVVKLHEEIMVPLKKREDDAKKMLAELTLLTQEFDRKKKELEDSASTKRGWAFALAFIPGVNVIATPMLAYGAECDLAAAIAEGAQRSVTENAIIVVGNSLIPALKAFIDGLDAIAGFFSMMEQELLSFQGKGEKAQNEAKKLHYTMMKKRAKDIKGYCQSFFAMIPGVRTDFLAIPDINSDQNYVDEWLEKKEKEIAEKYSARLTSSMRKMISYFSSEEARNPMIELNRGDATGGIPL